MDNISSVHHIIEPQSQLKILFVVTALLPPFMAQNCMRGGLASTLPHHPGPFRSYIETNQKATKSQLEVSCLEPIQACLWTKKVFKKKSAPGNLLVVNNFFTYYCLFVWTLRVKRQQFRDKQIITIVTCAAFCWVLLDECNDIKKQWNAVSVKLITINDLLQRISLFLLMSFAYQNIMC